MLIKQKIEVKRERMLMGSAFWIEGKAMDREATILAMVVWTISKIV